MNEKELRILLDTVTYMNFISQDFATFLSNFSRNDSSIVYKCNCTSQLVCSAFNECQLTSKELSFNISVEDPLHDVSVNCASLQTKVVTSLPCNVVIDRKTIATTKIY